MTTEALCNEAQCRKSQYIHLQNGKQKGHQKHRVLTDFISLFNITFELLN